AFSGHNMQSASSDKSATGAAPPDIQAAKRAVPSGLANKSESGAQRPSALVADDDPRARTLLAKLMTSWGYDVVAVSDCEQALDTLRRADGPGVAVLDRMMDGADGIEVCQRIRGIHNSRYIYIILLTSRDQQSDLIEGLSAGADDYLTKPFDPMELRA